MDVTVEEGGDSAVAQIVVVESDAANGQEESQIESEALSPTPKPLKSILKRRKPDDETAEEPVSKPVTEVVPVIEKPKGGSITQALKMITSITRGSDDEDFDMEPKPSAFILEMEKQKDRLQIMVPGAFSFPSRLEGIEVADMDWQSTSPPQPEVNSFFAQEQMRLKEKREKKDQQKSSHIISKPPQPKKITITKGPLTMLTPHEDVIEGIVFINNLPFKVTVDELVKILGIWPKGGYEGIKLMVDSNALPAGYAYVMVERHSDMMDILRLSGLEMQGRKIRCSKSNRESLIHDWKISKKALATLNSSRVVKVAQLPYSLKKSELIKALDRVKFNKDDIYWSALISGQTNSGRGFIVLESSEDAKTLSRQKDFRAAERMIEVTQVHPSDLEKFCKQCKLDIKEEHILSNPVTENFEDISDLNLNCVESKEASDKSSARTPSYSNFVVTDELENPPKLVERDSAKNKNMRISRRYSRERDIPTGGVMPPFQPTIFVRMYNVPEKATFDDIRTFFDPILPAKINQNHVHSIYDLEFYNPDEAMRSMRKHTLLMRKNVISLEMLPRPPTPLPPRPFQIPQGAAPPGMMLRMDPGIGRGPFSPRMGPPGPMMSRPMPSGMGMGPGPLGPMSGFGGSLPMPPGSMPGPGGLPISRGPMTERGVLLPGPGDPIHGQRRLMPGPSGPMLGPGGLMPGPRGPMPGPGGLLPGPRGPMFGPGGPMMMLPGPMMPGLRGPFPAPGVIDPQRMPPPMRDHRSSADSRKRYRKKSPSPERRIKPKKELIPVPPLPEDFTTYKVPPFKEDTPVGQGLITTMQGYFCQLCNKFYSSRASAKDAHCKTRGHYDRLKQFLQEKKRLRKLAENEAKRK